MVSPCAPADDLPSPAPALGLLVGAHSRALPVQRSCRRRPRCRRRPWRRSSRPRRDRPVGAGAPIPASGPKRGRSRQSAPAPSSAVPTSSWSKSKPGADAGGTPSANSKPTRRWPWPNATATAPRRRSRTTPSSASSGACATRARDRRLRRRRRRRRHRRRGRLAPHGRQTQRGRRRHRLRLPLRTPDLAAVAWSNPGETRQRHRRRRQRRSSTTCTAADFVGAELRSDPGGRQRPDRRRPDLRRPRRPHRGHDRGRGEQRHRRSAGVAQNVRIMPLRVCSRHPELERSALPGLLDRRAINYAGANGARVANMSLGGTSIQPGPSQRDRRKPAGLFVIAAGNDGGDNDGSDTPLPLRLPAGSDASPAVPGAIDNVVCVAATRPGRRPRRLLRLGRGTSVDLGGAGDRDAQHLPGLRDRFEDALRAATTSPRNGRRAATDGGFEPAPARAR